VCALHCAQLLHTLLHRTDLIIFPLTLYTITIAPMMSIWGKGETMVGVSNLEFSSTLWPCCLDDRRSIWSIKKSWTTYSQKFSSGTTEGKPKVNRFTGKMAAKISAGGSDPHIKNNARSQRLCKNFQSFSKTVHGCFRIKFEGLSRTSLSSKTAQGNCVIGRVIDWVGFNIPLNTLYVISWTSSYRSNDPTRK